MLLLLVFISVVTVVSAETGYRLVHPDGTVEFTDDSLSGGEEFELRVAPATVFESASPNVRARPGGEEEGSTGANANGSITITAPEANQTQWADGSGVTVSVALTPALESGQQIAITLDGVEIARGTTSSFNLGQVFRGSYTIGASVVTSSGKVLFSAPSIPFHVRQHSSIKRQTSEPTEPE